MLVRARHGAKLSLHKLLCPSSAAHALTIYLECGRYASAGTALALTEDEEKKRTKKSQYALDEQGRRRFHGAFTGGFSAGYYNTVGSKEGAVHAAE